MAAKLKPYKFTPILKPVLWGGEKIAALKGIECSMNNVGESWEISSIEDNVSVVATGDEAGTSLEELIARHGEALVGAKVLAQHGTQFPLLVKFIDAAGDLSVQVHPTDEMALLHDEPNGKSEMWYVIEAEEGASVINGLKQSILPITFDESVESGNITEHTAQFATHAGDVFSLPAGQIHSIGAGNLIAEVQQASVTTYRIYDWDRTDANGKPRTLHTRLAREAIDFDRKHDGAPIDYDRHTINELVPLVRNEHFTVSRVVVDDRFGMTLPQSFVIFMCMSGEASLTDNWGNIVTLHQGETVLVPASTRQASLHGDATLLVVWVD
ncbi:MAG: class I mannose-6-phosphate isomerase [Muribaculaceae bacterium]|nr:class I mannose-6-phosphate isomerase [Muribaculaceae bacterium]